MSALIEVCTQDGKVLMTGTQKQATAFIAAQPAGGHYCVRFKPTLASSASVKYYGPRTSSCVKMNGQRVTGYKF